MERFYVLESRGYLSIGTSAHRSTEVMILDRDYCHHVIWRACSGQNLRGYQGKQPVDRLRSIARAKCHALNAENSRG